MKQKTIVYVVNKKGKPLMPTTRCGHVRKLLDEKKAVVINSNPFTIRLKYETPDIVQALALGVDTGRENIGEGVSNEGGDCLFLCETETNNKYVTKNMAERKVHRQERRRHARQKKQRRALSNNTAIQNGNDDVLRNKKECKSVKTRYPGMKETITQKAIHGDEAQFNNRKRSEGWLTPSARQLIQITMNCVKQTMKILPITEICLERVCFDFQKIANQNIHSWEYSKGPLYGYPSYKDYVAEQQYGKCLICGCNHIDAYHHIIPKSKGGSDAVGNFAGLCDKCHDAVHKQSEVQESLIELKEGLYKEYKVSLLNSVMPQLIGEMHKFCSDNGILFTITDGIQTSKTRKNLNLDKSHGVDGYCISRCNKENTSVGIMPKVCFKRRRFKKKSNNNIKSLGSRLYKYNGEIVAKNRHKATEQKEPSLEEYLSDYKAKYGELATKRHIHELKVSPAKRTYTFHKKGLVQPIHAGDKVKFSKKNKVKGNTKTLVFIADSINMSTEKVCHDSSKNKRLKYCKRIESGCLSYVGFAHILSL